MICNGHIYGVILNDSRELAQLEPAFQEKPYLAPPTAPVVYMKPASTVSRGTVRLKPGQPALAAATLALLIARDATGVSPEQAMECVGAAALAIDITYPQVDYYRPAVAQRNADTFLVMGEWGPPVLADRITTVIDGQAAHSWSLDRLVRAPNQLIADVSAFLTLRAGDVLLVGLPGDAPQVHAGAMLCAEAEGFEATVAQIEELAR